MAKAKKDNLLKRIWAKLGILNKILVFVGLIIPIILSYNSIKDLFKSDEEKHEDEIFISGKLNTPKITMKSGNMYKISDVPPNFRIIPKSVFNPTINGIHIDSLQKRKFLFVFLNGYLFTCSVNDLKKGVKLFNTGFSNCTDSNLTLGVKGDELYVSTNFKDIEKEETVGFIEFNHWKIYKPNYLRIQQDDNRFEVRDKQYNIIFSIGFAKKLGLIFLSGYFISAKHVMIIKNPLEFGDFSTATNVKFNEDIWCIPKDYPKWKEASTEKIEQIVSVFK